MANGEDDLLLQKERSLELLLKEGKRYLFMMDELRNCVRIDSTEYKRMLFVMDRYTRYKMQLREDIEELKEIFGVHGLVYVEYETEEGRGPGYLVFDLEDEDEDEDEDDLFLEEESRHFNNIVRRKNILANMEMLILRMLHMDGTLLNVQQAARTKLRDLLGSYCERVRAFLKRNATLAESQDRFGETRSIENIWDKYKQLQQLLVKLGQVWSKRQIYVGGNAAGLHGFEGNEEEKCN